MNKEQQKYLSYLFMLIGTALSIPFGDFLINSVKNQELLGFKENIAAIFLFVLSSLPFYGAFLILDTRFTGMLKLKRGKKNVRRN